MALLWQDVKNWLTDATKTAIREAEDLTRKGKLKIDMLNLNRKLEKDFAELGGIVYHLRQSKKQKDLQKNAEVKLLVKKIQRLEAQLRTKKREWKKRG
jgi:pyridoxine/pyridoxamine 5'-phosphate oxidase